jgi:hypothetical protein
MGLFVCWRLFVRGWNSTVIVRLGALDCRLEDTHFITLDSNKKQGIFDVISIDHYILVQQRIQNVNATLGGSKYYLISCSFIDEVVK